MTWTPKIVLVVFCAYGLVGCGAKLPSCGDPEATKLVKEILTEAVTDDTGVYKQQIQSLVNFEVSEAIVKAKDKETGNYTCEAKARYLFTKERFDALAKVIQSEHADPLNIIFHKTLGIPSDTEGSVVIGKLLGETKQDPEAQKKWLLAFNHLFETEFQSANEIDKRRDEDPKFNTMVMAVQMSAFNPSSDANLKKIEAQSNDLQMILNSIEKSGSFSHAMDIAYSINKIDGKKGEFKVSAEWDTGEINGIQNLELYWSTYQDYKNKLGL